MAKAKYIVVVNKKSFFRNLEIQSLPQLATNQTYTLRIGAMVFTPKSIQEEVVEECIFYTVFWEVPYTLVKRAVFDPNAEESMIENGYKRLTN